MKPAVWACADTKGVTFLYLLSELWTVDLMWSKGKLEPSTGLLL